MNITVHLGTDTPKTTPPSVLTDESPMPFGKYKGAPLEEVPAHYLLWLWDKDDGLWSDESKRNAPLRDYVKRSFMALRQECPNMLVLHDPKHMRETKRLSPLSAAELSDTSDGVTERPDNLCTDDDDIPF